MGFDAVLSDDLERWRSLFADIQSAAGNSLLILAAGAVGATVDEAHHWGLRMLIALCASGPIPFYRSIALEFQLLPAMIVAMIVGMTITIGIQSTASKTRRRQARHIGVAAAHIGCMAAMLSSIAVCTSLFGVPSGFFEGALVMLASDSLVGITIAIVSVIVLHWMRASAIRPAAVS